MLICVRKRMKSFLYLNCSLDMVVFYRDVVRTENLIGVKSFYGFDETKDVDFEANLLETCKDITRDNLKNMDFYCFEGEELSKDIFEGTRFKKISEVEEGELEKLFGNPNKKLIGRLDLVNSLANLTNFITSISNCNDFLTKRVTQDLEAIKGFIGVDPSILNILSNNCDCSLNSINSTLSNATDKTVNTLNVLLSDVTNVNNYMFDILKCCVENTINIPLSYTKITLIK